MLNTAIFILLCLIWGSTWLAMKIGLDGAPVFLGAGLRFVIAAVLLSLATTVAGKWNLPFKRTWRHIFMAGFLTFPLPYTLVYWGTQYVDSGLAAVLFATMPFFVAFMAHMMIPEEKLTIAKGVGMLLGFLGIYLIFNNSLGAKGILGTYGMTAIVISSFFSASGMVIIKKYLHDVDPLPLTAIQTAIGAVALMILGLAVESLSDFRADGKTWGSILYLGVMGTALAFSLYLYLLQKMEATKLATIAFLTPLVALFLGMIYRKESLDPMSIVGSLLVILGILVVITGGILRRARPTPETGA